MRFRLLSNGDKRYSRMNDCFKRLLVILLFFSPFVLAEGDFPLCGAEGDLLEIEKRAALVTQRLIVAEGLYAGRLAPDFSLRKLLGVAIDNESDVQLAMVADRELEASLRARSRSLSQATADDCGVNGVSYQAALADVIDKELQWLIRKKQVLTLSRSTRLRLLRLSRNWQIMALLDESIRGVEAQLNAEEPFSSGAQDFEEGESISIAQKLSTARSVLNWHELMRRQLERWAGMLVAPEMAPDAVTEVWREMLVKSQILASLSYPAVQALQEDAYRLAIVPKQLENERWVSLINNVYSEMRLETSHWRNRQVWSGGVRPVALKLVNDPTEFLQNLGAELVFLPDVFIDSVTRPFMRELRSLTSDSERAAGSQFLLWGAQGVSLGLVAWLLYAFAHGILRAVAHCQNALLAASINLTTKRLVSVLFRALKPNIFWLTIAVSSYYLMTWIPPKWFVLQWVGPLGGLFASFIAARVISEWVISHTYARAGKFFSVVVAEQAVKTSRHMAWWVVVIGLLVWGVWETGGGELLFLLLLLVALTGWMGLARVINHYHEAVYPFVLQVGRHFGFAHGKNKPDKSAKPGRLLRIAFPVVYPVCFAVDLAFVVHDRLMVFDLYRKMSVKLLRIRLDAPDAIIVEEGAKDFRYRDWLLRTVEDGAPVLENMLAEATNPVEQWVDGQTDDNVLLIIGEQGSGKTELARQLDARFTSVPFQYHNFSGKVLTKDAFYEAISQCFSTRVEDATTLESLDQSFEKQVIVLDAIENLFLSEVGCLEGYRALIGVLNLQLSNVFWVVLIHAPSWNYLKHVFDKEQRFSNLIQMPSWSAAKIRKLILSRHQGSELRVKYDEMLLSAAATSESASIRTADARVFNILWEQCDGNPLLALHLWLKAANRRGRVLEVGLPEKPGMNPLKNASEDALFIYASLISHHTLNVEEIMKVSHFSEPVVRQALKHGITQGMLVEDPGGRYGVHPLWQANLGLYLRRKNLVW